MKSIAILAVASVAAMASAEGTYSNNQPAYSGGYYPNNQYCQVKGFPGKQFKVGCSYVVQGKFNCYDWDRMTIWCTSGGSHGSYRYCCGSACNRMNPPRQCGAVPPAPRPPTPPPVYSCNYGQGKNDYNSGFTSGKKVMSSSFNQIGKNCDQLDSLYSTVKSNAPTFPACNKKGYVDGVTNQYKSLQSGCISNCRGSGKANGQSKGQTFCAVAMLTMSSPTKGFTQAICDATEAAYCQTTFENYVQNNCPDKQFSSNDYYNELYASCSDY